MTDVGQRFLEPDKADAPRKFCAEQARLFGGRSHKQHRTLWRGCS